MVVRDMSTVAWVESPLQLVGAAEWADAAGERVTIAGRLTAQMSETADELLARDARFGVLEPYLGIPWKLLSQHGHWLVGDGYSGQFRLAAAVLRPKRLTFLDDGAQCHRVRRHAARAPGLRASRHQRARTHDDASRRSRWSVIHGRALAGRVEVFTAFDLGADRVDRLRDLGIRTDAARVRVDAADRARGRRSEPAACVLGSAQPVDGRLDLDVYLDWVAAEAAIAPVAYLPHRRETRGAARAVVAIPGVRLVETAPAGRARARRSAPSRSRCSRSRPARRRRCRSCSRAAAACCAPGIRARAIAARPSDERGARQQAGGLGRSPIRDRRGHPRARRVEGRAAQEPAPRRRRAARRPRRRGRARRRARRPGRRLHRRRRDRGRRRGVGRAGRRAVPPSIAGDTASSESALLHALDALAQRRGRRRRRSRSCRRRRRSSIPGRWTTASASSRTASSTRVFSAIETYGFLWRRDAAGAADGVNHDPRHPSAPAGSRTALPRDRRLLRDGCRGLPLRGAPVLRQGRHRRGRRDAPPSRSTPPTELEIARAIAPLARTPWLGRAIDVDAVVTDFDGVHTDDTVLVDALRHRDRARQQVGRHGGRAAAGRRHPGAHPLDRDEQGRRRARPQAAGRRAPGGRRQGGGAARLGRGAAASRSRASRTSATTSTTSSCLEIVGWPVAVPEAHPLVLAAARVILVAQRRRRRRSRPRRPRAARPRAHDIFARIRRRSLTHRTEGTAP